MADPKQAALAAAWAVQQAGADAWNGLCELFVEQAYGTRGQFPAAKDAIPALKPRRSLDGAKPGDVVLFAADSSNGFNGHAGIYLGNGRMVSATPQGVKETGILDDPYYARLFVGVGEAPAEWKGQASTDKLEQGAQRILEVAGASAMADTPTSGKLTSLKREERDLAARLDQNKRDLTDYAKARDLVPAYRESKERDAVWLPKNGVTKAEMDHLEEVYDRVTDDKTLRAEVTKDERDLRTLRVQIGDAEDDARTAANKPPPTTTSLQYNTDASDQFILQRNPDGTLKLDASGKPVTLPNPNYKAPEPKAAPARRTQVVGNNLIDLDTGAVITQLPAAAQNKRTQVVGNWLIDLDTGNQVADLSAALAKPAEPPKPQSQMVNGRQVPIDPTTGVADPSRAVDLYTPEERAAEQRKLQPPGMPALADPFANLKQEQARRQQLAQAERDRLLGLQSSGVLTPDQAAQQFETYWAREVDAPLAGLRALAEQAQAAAKAQNETLQRTENQRAEGINRQREQYGYEQGEKARTTAAGLVPGVRSAAFLDKYAQSINAFSGNSAAPTWSAADFRPDASQIPDLNAIAAQETARALAHISPAAAARVGAPIPDLAAMPDLNSFLPAFRLPAPAAAAPVG